MTGTVRNNGTGSESRTLTGLTSSRSATGSYVAPTAAPTAAPPATTKPTAAPMSKPTAAPTTPPAAPAPTITRFYPKQNYLHYNCNNNAFLNVAWQVSGAVRYEVHLIYKHDHYLPSNRGKTIRKMWSGAGSGAELLFKNFYNSLSENIELRAFSSSGEVSKAAFNIYNVNYAMDCN